MEINKKWQHKRYSVNLYTTITHRPSVLRDDKKNDSKYQSIFWNIKVYLEYIVPEDLKCVSFRSQYLNHLSKMWISHSEVFVLL